MGFNNEQVRQLSAKLDASHIRTRKQAGRDLSYIEGWHAIAEANRIFGFDAWDRGTIGMRQLGEPREVDGKWRVSYMAKVRVLVRFEGGQCIREGTGYGSGIDRDLGAAHESAIKEAETDAMKRALMTFGNPFGLALYDKEQENVEREAVRAAPRPPNGDDPRATAEAIKDQIDEAADVQGVNAVMVRRGFQVNGDPKPGSDLAKIRAFSATAYDFLIERANKRRAALIHKPESNAA